MSKLYIIVTDSEHFLARDQSDGLNLQFLSTFASECPLAGVRYFCCIAYPQIINLQ